MIYPGARQVGMGGAFTGNADDAFASYYNPAGLAFQKNINMSISQSDWLPWLYPGMSYYYGSLILPVSKMTMSISWTYLTTGTTEVTDENGNYLGEYRTYDMAPAISIGKKVSDNFAVGGTFKYVYSFLVPSWVWEAMPEIGLDVGGTGKSIALDIGSLVSFSSFGKTGLGLVIQNIGPGIYYTHTSEKDPLPTAMKIGLSQQISLKDIAKFENYHWFINWLIESSKLTVASDVYYSLVSGEFWYSLGGEICLAPLTFRTGYFYDPIGVRKGRTIGFGINLRYLQLNVTSDADIYDFTTDNLRYDLSIKLPDNIKF
jgi:hypothetical protein